MNILIIGSGGRENALAFAIKKSQSCSKLYASPGNPGIARYAELVTLNSNNFDEIINYCKKENIELVVIGPEQIIATGLPNVLRENEINVFSPSLEAGILEISKGYAKEFMHKYSIPTADFKVFQSKDIKEAHIYIEKNSNVVIKADGLAAGKGVIIPTNSEEAHKAIDEIFSGLFGESGNSIVIEEFMQGDEASIFALCDGNDYVILPASQDHKRIGNGDTGKNTGGMGAYAPTRLVTDEILLKVENEIIKPTLIGMKKEGKPFIGCMFLGLMINGSTVKVVEYNCRFGDPETESVMALIEGDFAKLLYSAAIGKIDKKCISIKSQTACTVIIASNGYPDNFQKGFEIKGLQSDNDHTIVFHCGTSLKDGKVVSNGGRVLAITGIGKDLQESIDTAYKRVKSIEFENAYYRSDIGNKGLNY